MMLTRALFIVVLSAILGTTGTGGTAKTEDAKKLQGTWKFVSVEGAEKAPPDGFKNIRMKISADKLVVMAEGKEVNSQKYKINDAKNPREIDLVVKVLLDRGDVVVASDETRQGIYELKDDRLKICIALATNKKTPTPAGRPTEFKTRGDLTIMVLEREK
ncbi:MAG TPA: TIGR03067 domain-containing protein [Gemmataceae bacterium]|nr:TIGR03067 domain-containing protein [Gemmataceae bacterium]